MWPKKRVKKKWQVIPKVRSSGKSGRDDRKPKEECGSQKRSKRQGVGGKPTMVKTFAAKGGSINKKPGNSGLFGRR